MTTGEKIRHYREEAGMTQKELADKLGFVYQRIWQYENGTRNAKLSLLIKIAEALNVDYRDLQSDDHYLDTNESDRIFDLIDTELQTRGLSRRSLALAAGIPPSSLQTAFERRHNMSLEMLFKIQKIIDIPKTFLPGVIADQRTTAEQPNPSKAIYTIDLKTGRVLSVEVLYD